MDLPNDYLSLAFPKTIGYRKLVIYKINFRQCVDETGLSVWYLHCFLGFVWIFGKNLKLKIYGCSPTGVYAQLHGILDLTLHLDMETRKWLMENYIKLLETVGFIALACLETSIKLETLLSM